MEYLKFYKLDEEPFRNDPNPGAYYQGQDLERVRMRVLRVVEQRKDLCTIVGESGAGKTALARHLLEELAARSSEVRLLQVPHADCDAGWLRRRVAHAFGVAEPAREPLRVLAQIYEQFMAFEEEGKLPLLLIDDAQLLLLEDARAELRGLLSLEHQGRSLLTVLLFGLPSLDDVMRQDPVLGQRVDGRVCLSALGREETAAYVSTRIESVQGDPAIFADDAVDAIFRYAQGVPRVINTLADNSLFEGFLSEANPIDASAVAAAAQQLGLAEIESEAKTVPTVPQPGDCVAPFDRAEDLSDDSEGDPASGADPTLADLGSVLGDTPTARPTRKKARKATPKRAETLAADPRSEPADPEMDEIEAELDREISQHDPLDDSDADSLSNLDDMFEKIKVQD